MEVVNKVTPTPEQFEQFFSQGEDGPFIMVNLLKFRDRAEYRDGSYSDKTGADAYRHYADAVQKHIASVGAKSLTSGAVTGLMLGEVEELWDMVGLVEYPSLQAFQAMLTTPEYQEIAVHREAGLAGQLNIKVKPAKVSG